MPWSDIFQMAWRNIGQARLRFVLTCLGVLIAISTLVALVSFGAGLRLQTVGNLEVREVFTSFQILGPARSQSFRRFRDSGPDSATPTARPVLDQDLVRRVAALEGVVSVQPDIRFAARLEHGDKVHLTRVRGAGPHVAPLSPYSKITQGRFLSGTQGAEIVLTGRVARRLGFEPPEQAVGKTIQLLTDRLKQEVSDGDLPFETVRFSYQVVGVLPRLLPNQTNPFFRGVVVPLEEARELWKENASGMTSLSGLTSLEEGRGREYDSIDVRVADLMSLERVREEVRSWGAATFAIVDQMKRIQEAFLVLEVVLGVLGGIAMLVASLGIANVLIISVMERRQVIGIMKAIGGTDRDVRRIFLAEAGLIGFSGGVMGLLAGWTLTRIATVFIDRYFQSHDILNAPNLFAYPLWLVAGAIGFAVGLSLLSGVIPANRATRVDPVEALRQG